MDTPATFRLGSFAKRGTWRAFTRRGIKVRVACTGAMRGTAKLTVTRSQARKLRLGSRRTLASRSVRCWGKETRTVTLKPSRSVARKLRNSRRSVQATLQVSMRDEGKTTRATRRIALRR